MKNFSCRSLIDFLGDLWETVAEMMAVKIVFCLLFCMFLCLHVSYSVLERVIVVSEHYEQNLSQRIKSSLTDRYFIVIFSISVYNLSVYKVYLSLTIKQI